MPPGMRPPGMPGMHPPGMHPPAMHPPGMHPPQGMPPMMGTPPSDNKRQRPADFHGAFVPSDAPPASLVRQFAGGAGGAEELKRELQHCGGLLDEERRQRQTADSLAQERGRELQEARARLAEAERVAQQEGSRRQAAEAECQALRAQLTAEQSTLRFTVAQPGAVAAPAQAASAEAPTGTKVWFFSDSNGVQQGPFDTVSMKQWFEQNYFLPTTLMRRADQPAGTPGEAWRALEQLGAQPFGRSW